MCNSNQAFRVCFQCTKRHVGCHSECKDYSEEVIRYQKEKEKQRKEKAKERFN